MSASYIPKDVYTICTFQTDLEPRQLIPTREIITVFYGTDKTRPLLTVEDRNINKEFPCKSPKNAMWSFLCFGAGLIVGALLIASGPVGWLIVAGVASMAIGAYYATKIEHKCSGALGDSSSSWKIEHMTVKFDQKHAITHNSMLSCSAGGILTPVFSYAVAKRYAEEINKNNGKEATFNAIASFFGGAGAALSIAEMGLALTVKWALGTMAFVHVGTTVQREVIRKIP
ncbi:hypothetical protein [Chryseobacterium gossypii]|uniref:hypothetical protein n=1 Tax=Chryseobacterium gossypii TaxID=3231602 RepID=UPI0035233963